MNRFVKTFVLVGAAAALAGCSAFSQSCHEPQDYQQATSVPPLKVPDGLTAPQTRGALKIPDVPAAARARGASDPCLDEPPSFYPNRPKPGLRNDGKDSGKGAKASAPTPADAAPAAAPPAEPPKP